MENVKKFRGIVIDQMGTIDTRKTIFYSTYQEAHEKAEKLCKKTMRERGQIEVEEKE